MTWFRRKHKHDWPDPWTINMLWASHAQGWSIKVYCRTCRQEHVVTGPVSLADINSW